MESSSNGLSVNYQYDKYGQLLSTTDQSGRQTQFEYTSDGLLATVIQATGQAIVMGYDGRGRQISLSRAGIGTRTVRYDILGQVISSTDELYHTTQYEYDLLGRITTVTDPLNNTNSVTYTLDGNLATTTDALGNTVEYHYDSLGRLSKKGSGSNFEEYTYNAQGRLSKYTNTLGLHTTYAYDPNQEWFRSTSPIGAETTYSFDRLGRLTAALTPDPDAGWPQLPALTQYVYDDAGRTVSVIDGLNQEQTFAYNEQGRLQEAKTPLGLVTSYTYTTDGQIDKITAPSGRVTDYDYDTFGRLASITDPGGNKQSRQYDTNGRLWKVTDPRGATTTYAYDATDNLISLTDGLGNVTSWTYDALRRLVSESTTEGTREYEYDAVGNLQKATDRLDQVRTFDYQYRYTETGAAYQMTHEKWWDEETLLRDISFTYTTVGQLDYVTDPGANYDYTYDAVGRLTDVTRTGEGPTFNLQFFSDYLGRRDWTIASINGKIDFVNRTYYDPLNRVTRITQAGTGGGYVLAPKRVDIGYTEDGEFDTVARYNDVDATKLVATTQFSRADGGDLTGIDHAQGLVSLAAYSWEYDDTGRIEKFTSPTESVDYTYDSASQLTSADHDIQVDELYTYDANGNRTLPGYVKGAYNRLLSDGVYNYTYDAEGNRKTQTEIATGNEITYKWDFRQRLTELEFRNNSNQLTKRILYTYDAFDRLVKKELDSNGDSSIDATERYYYDGSDVVLVLNGAGSLINRYLHGPTIDQIFADENALGEVLWALSDNQGTVRDWAKRNSTTGTTSIVDHLEYDAYGQITSHTDPSNGGATSTRDIDYAYTGREWDADANLYYYRARWYDPHAGRFISEDPIGFAGGDTNVQRYVGNSPTNANDPSGLEEMVLIPAGKAIIGGQLVTVPYAMPSAVPLNSLSAALQAAIKVDIVNHPKEWAELQQKFAEDADWYLTKEQKDQIAREKYAKEDHGPSFVNAGYDPSKTNLTQAEWEKRKNALLDLDKQIRALEALERAQGLSQSGEMMLGELRRYRKGDPSILHYQAAEAIWDLLTNLYAGPKQSGVIKSKFSRLKLANPHKLRVRAIPKSNRALYCPPANTSAPSTVAARKSLPPPSVTPEPPPIAGPASLTGDEAEGFQRIANKYKIVIYVGGSRAQGRGRNVERPELPAGDKGPGTRSDIDYIFDSSHPQKTEIHRELQSVGNAGEPHPHMSAQGPYRPELSITPDKDVWRFKFSPGEAPKVIPTERM